MNLKIKNLKKKVLNFENVNRKKLSKFNNLV